MKKRKITRESLAELAKTMPILIGMEQSNYIGQGDPITCSDPRVQSLFIALRDSTTVNLYGLTGGYASGEIGATTVYIGSDSIKVEGIYANTSNGYHPTSSTSTNWIRRWFEMGTSWDIWRFSAPGTNLNSLMINIDKNDYSKMNFINRQ